MSDQLALEDASSNGVGYLGGEVRCFVRGGKGGYIFEVIAGFHGTVNDDRCSQRVGRQRSHRTKHIDVKHHLVRDACDAGKSGVCQDER